MLTREEWIDRDMVALAAMVESGKVAPRELLQTAIREIEAQNPRVNAVVVTQFEEALDALEARVAQGERPRFLGVPYLIKDLHAPVKGMPLSNGSGRFKGTVFDFDSTLVGRLRAAGFGFLGRSASPEFGLTLETDSAAWGTTRNPWDPERGAGGSSGGAGAAVASGMMPAAHATDSAGSIRIPAAYNGLVGLKPSRALNPFGPHRGDPNHGISHEHAVTVSVRDSAALLDVTAGPDTGAPYFTPKPDEPFESLIARAPERLRIGLVTTRFDGQPVDPDCAEAAAMTGRLLSDLGHEVEEAMPEFDVNGLTDAMIRVLLASLAGLFPGAGALEEADLAGLEPTTRTALRYSRSVSLSDHFQRLMVMNREVRRLASYFDRYDLMITPATATPPPPHRSLPMTSTDLDAFLEKLFDLSPFSAPFNASGMPAIVLPIHQTAEGLPVAAQIVGPLAADALVLRAAHQVEQARPFRRRPA
ncbi:putative amidase [Pseudooceanicola batsensis HTCC2597]|uniref:Putative amidase n=1 Tax=Pseudooceanicola batsensis (strain ATCC BAA-863 / DSM 15984 / KCTC 12145 / HTCC2597) TaxID=252305 RepID=A3TUE4_PSEBH|nr:amidase [Pseudooceanicola batsensis]EAQ04140.1 putative amidase [Pseudooceanicola batsensis HTCC2597]